MAASTISFKEPREFWKFDKIKLNPFNKDERPIGISYDHASKYLSVFVCKKIGREYLYPLK